MSYGELYIPAERPQYNAVTGCFLKYHVPHNKGKKWNQYAGKRAQKRMAKGWVNLRKYKPKERPDTAERCRKPIIAVLDDGSWKYFSWAGVAATWIQANQRNIRRCCSFNAERHVNKKTGSVNTDHKLNGVRFYFEEDDIWTTKIK